MNRLTVLAGICGLANCAKALVPFGTIPQQAVINGPSTVESPFSTFLELNLDDAEYRIHFKEGGTYRNLSCKANYMPTDNTENPTGQTELENNDTVHLPVQLYHRNSFPFWLMESFRLPESLSNTTSHIYHPRVPNPEEAAYLIGGYAICSTFLANQSTIGMVYWDTSLGTVCQVVSNGSLVKMPQFSPVLNPTWWILGNYTWANVSNWTDLPPSATIISTDGIYGALHRDCSNRSGILTGKRYIGKLSYPGVDPVILSVPEEGALPPGFPIDGVGVTRQVLVPEKLVHHSLQESLVCQAAPGTFTLSQYREEVDFSVKVVPGQGKEEAKLEKAIGDGVIFSKGSQALAWRHSRTERSVRNPVIAGKDSYGLSLLICRYRCVKGENLCPSYVYPSNGSLHRRSIDKTIGFLNRNNAFYRSKWSCDVSFNGAPYRSFIYDWLANSCQAKVSWTSFTGLSPANGTVVVSETNGEKFAIGRMSLPGKGDTVAQVDLRFEKITLSDGSTTDWETVKESVDILMVQD